MHVVLLYKHVGVVPDPPSGNHNSCAGVGTIYLYGSNPTKHPVVQCRFCELNRKKATRMISCDMSCLTCLHQGPPGDCQNHMVSTCCAQPSSNKKIKFSSQGARARPARAFLHQVCWGRLRHEPRLIFVWTSAPESEFSQSWPKMSEEDLAPKLLLSAGFSSFSDGCPDLPAIVLQHGKGKFQHATGLVIWEFRAQYCRGALPRAPCISSTDLDTLGMVSLRGSVCLCACQKTLEGARSPPPRQGPA